MDEDGLGSRSILGAVALIVYLLTSYTYSFLGSPRRNDFLLQLTCIKDSRSLAITLAKLFNLFSCVLLFIVFM